MKRMLPIIVIVLILLVGISYYRTVDVNAVASHVVISEVQIEGVVSSTDEFVELYNPTGSSIDITGWHLQKKTQLGGDPVTVATLSGTIPPHGYFLIAHTNYDGSVPENQTYDTESFSPNNTVILHSDSLGVVDKVGMGTATDYEGTDQASVPPDDRSIERKAFSDSTADSMVAGGAHVSAGNGEDTDDNSMDFVLRSTAAGTDPQNASSITEDPTTPTPTPTSEVSGTPTEIPTETLTPTETPTNTPTSTPTNTPTGTPTETLTPTSTPTETLTVTPTEEPTNTPTHTPTSTPTPTDEQTPTPTNTPTNTPTPTDEQTPTPTDELTPTVTPTETPTVTPTSTPMPTVTQTPPHVLGIFSFFRTRIECRQEYQVINLGFMQLQIPRFMCVRV